MPRGKLRHVAIFLIHIIAKDPRLDRDCHNVADRIGKTAGPEIAALHGSGDVYRQAVQIALGTALRPEELGIKDDGPCDAANGDAARDSGFLARRLQPGTGKGNLGEACGIKDLIALHRGRGKGQAHFRAGGVKGHADAAVGGAGKIKQQIGARDRHLPAKGVLAHLDRKRDLGGCGIKVVALRFGPGLRAHSQVNGQRRGPNGEMSGWMQIYGLS
jgi:hypothetical protein